jgi:hypothetical protein
VQRAIKLRLLDFVAPVFLGIGFVVKRVYNLAFAWWLDPLLRRKANRWLLDETTANLYFLVSEPHADVRSISARESEWPTVEISWENSCSPLCDGAEIQISPSRRVMPHENLISLVRLSLHWSADTSRSATSLADAANLLRMRLQALNAAFSEHEFPRIKESL